MADDVFITDYVAEEHEHLLLANIRDMDRRELMLMSGLEPTTGLRMTVELSVRCWSGFYRGELACVFGVNRKGVLSDIGVPWLVGTPVIEKAPVAFLRGSKAYSDLFSRAFPQMENFVFAENKVAIHWLKWLGFDMDEPTRDGFTNAPFVRFSKGMNDVL